MTDNSETVDTIEGARILPPSQIPCQSIFTNIEKKLTVYVLHIMLSSALVQGCYSDTL